MLRTSNLVLCDFLQVTYHILLTSDKMLSCYWVWGNVFFFVQEGSVFYLALLGLASGKLLCCKQIKIATSIFYYTVKPIISNVNCLDETTIHVDMILYLSLYYLVNDLVHLPNLHINIIPYLWSIELPIITVIAIEPLGSCFRCPVLGVRGMLWVPHWMRYVPKLCCQVLGVRGRVQSLILGEIRVENVYIRGSIPHLTRWIWRVELCQPKF